MTTQFTKDTAAKRASVMLTTIMDAAKPYLVELRNESLTVKRFDEIAEDVNEEARLGLTTVGECLTCLVSDDQGQADMFIVLYTHFVEDLES